MKRLSVLRAVRALRCWGAQGTGPRLRGWCSELKDKVSALWQDRGHWGSCPTTQTRRPSQTPWSSLSLQALPLFPVS